MKTFNFYEKSVYGDIMVYPKNDIAPAFKQLTGTKTLNKRQKDALIWLGINVNIEPLPKP